MMQMHLLRESIEEKKNMMDLFLIHLNMAEVQKVKNGKLTNPYHYYYKTVGKFFLKQHLCSF